jgi:DNA helicase-4
MRSGRGDFVSVSCAGRNWAIDCSVSGVVITRSGHSEHIDPDDVSRLSIRRRFWGLGRAELVLPGGDKEVSLAALRRGDQRELSRLFNVFVALRDAQIWSRNVDSVIDKARTVSRWVDSETIDDLDRVRPSDAALRGNGFEWGRFALDALSVDLSRMFADLNEEIIHSELDSHRWFFDCIDKSPMTEEQARAVITYDNRVQVVAAAGSGKTSVMVARAAYAIEKGFVSPEEILLLAFNKDAAEELQERIDERLSLAGIPTDGLKASTFHALGLSVIGKARGKRPSLAPWVESSQAELGVLSTIVDLLSEESQQFREMWDLYRLVFARVPVNDATEGRPDAPLDDLHSERGFKTFAGRVVRSVGERVIADWLFLNGVPFLYEAPYLHDTADAKHSQYRPDFFYPDPKESRPQGDPNQSDNAWQNYFERGTWHEHWALDADGNPPASFDGYAESIQWKRLLHEERETDLIETSWWGVLNGNDLDHLQKQLEARGHKFDWDPSRVLLEDEPVSDEQLLRLIRTFISHVKSNSLSRADLQVRLDSSPLAGTRSEIFLRLYWQIFDAWQERLSAGDYIDFDDMLIQAAKHLEAGDIELGYSLVLADEFQDASNARTRMLKGLVARRGRHLLAVGDDWQSVNRFAGADINAMLEFEETFGTAIELQLTRTFRCPPEIVRLSSEFIQKNPGQIPKRVTTSNPEPESGSVRWLLTDINPQAIEDELARIAKRAAEDPDGGKPTVLALGRYRFDQNLVSRSVIPKEIDYSFKTIHRAKGLEADYVLVLNLSARGWSFPASVVDDPILGLAMSKPDDFLYAEERRLFYVALTRAKKQVILLVPKNSPSEFIVEAFNDGILEADAPLIVCDLCRIGLLVRRTGRSGDFFGCSSYPGCTNKAQVCEHCAQGCLVRDGDTFRCNQPLCDRGSHRGCPKPKCRGMLTKRKGPRGEFFGCTEYRRGCETTSEVCPVCRTGSVIRTQHEVRCHKQDSCSWAGRPCPSCADGFLITKTGAYGPFTSCSNFTSKCADPKAIEWRRSKRS